MAEADDGTTTQGAEGAAGTQNASGSDEVTLLKSRLAGQDAKITELTNKATAAETAAAAAAAKLTAYEAKTVGADEALRAQLVAEQQKTQAAEQKAALALIKATYPEAFAELGDAAAGLTEEKLASIEARLQGVAADGEAKTPRGVNGARTGAAAGTAAKPPTIADVEAQIRAQAKNFSW